MIQRLVYKCGKGYGAVRQRSISIIAAILQAQNKIDGNKTLACRRLYWPRLLLRIYPWACTRATLLIQRLVYEFGEGHGAVRQRSISITSSTACTALQAQQQQLVRERLQWFNDLCMSAAKGMRQCDNVQSVSLQKEKAPVETKVWSNCRYLLADDFNDQTITKV